MKEIIGNLKSPHPKELIIKVIKEKSEGKSSLQLSEEYNLKIDTIRTWMKRYKLINGKLFIIKPSLYHTTYSLLIRIENLEQQIEIILQFLEKYDQRHK